MLMNEGKGNAYPIVKKVLQLTQQKKRQKKNV